MAVVFKPLLNAAPKTLAGESVRDSRWEVDSRAPAPPRASFRRPSPFVTPPAVALRRKGAMRAAPQGEGFSYCA